MLAGSPHRNSKWFTADCEEVMWWVFEESQVMIF